jgi:hypothetical protein
VNATVCKPTVPQGISIEYRIVQTTLFKGHRKEEMIAIPEVNACQFACVEIDIFQVGVFEIHGTHSAVLKLTIHERVL